MSSDTTAPAAHEEPKSNPNVLKFSENIYKQLPPQAKNRFGIMAGSTADEINKAIKDKLYGNDFFEDTRQIHVECSPNGSYGILVLTSNGEVMYELPFVETNNFGKYMNNFSEEIFRASVKRHVDLKISTNSLKFQIAKSLLPSDMYPHLQENMDKVSAALSSFCERLRAGENPHMWDFLSFEG